MTEAIERWEYGLRFDCEAEGCQEKLGYLHVDRDKVMTGDWQRGGPALSPKDLPTNVNGHLTKVVCRAIGEWQDYQGGPK